MLPLVTEASTVPAACAPVVAVIKELERTLTPVAAAPPRETVAPPEKPEPVTMTAVPPDAAPNDGLIEAMTGAVEVNVALEIVTETGP